MTAEILCFLGNIPRAFGSGFSFGTEWFGTLGWIWDSYRLVRVSRVLAFGLGKNLEGTVTEKVTRGQYK